MKADIKPFKKDNCEDAYEVIRARFGEDACRCAEQALQNPLMEIEGSAGDIAYEDGMPVGFQGAVVRHLHLNRQRIVGVVGMLLAMKVGASPVSLHRLMKATIEPRQDSKIFFANTALPSSMKLNRLLGVNGCGPRSSEKIRFSIIRVGRFLNILAHGKIPSIVVSGVDFILFPFHLLRMVMSCEKNTSVCVKITASAFDDFWCRYLSTFDGLVSSRTSEELEWIFGEGLSCGRHVLITHNSEDGFDGYIIIKHETDSPRWKIADLIALKNDRGILKVLIRAALKYLYKRGDAGMLELVGLPDSHKDVFSTCLPFVRKLKNNTFVYKFIDLHMEEMWHNMGNSNWFFGPYDGDQCL